MLEKLQMLARKEAEIAKLVESQTGFMEEKVQKLLKLGVFDQYNLIISQYCELFSDEFSSLEANKRVAYLTLLGSEEPSCFTGLNPPNEMRLKALGGLDKLFESKGADEELKWMVAWYYLLNDYLFINMQSFPHLLSFLNGCKFSQYKASASSEDQFCNRGAMGDYWESLFKSNALQLNANAK